MTIEEILKLKPEDAYKELSTKVALRVEADTILKQIDPYQHKVFDQTLRPKKTVKKPAGKDSQGKVKYEDRAEEVTRIAVPVQKLIVERAIGFTLGNPVTIQSDNEEGAETDLLNMIEKVWTDNKLQYFDRKLARALFSETEVAELWYFTKDEDYWEKQGVVLRPKVKILKASDGNKLIPKFDSYGDLIAFSREYSTEIEGKKVTVLDVYTKDKLMTYHKSGDGIVIAKNEANPIGKIPVVYYQQPYPDWYFVQPIIERLETLLSNFGDTNDYFGSPMVFVQGQVTGFASKGEQGKVLQGEKGAEAKYLSWDSAPEAVKLEIETLLELIYTNTQTPNISFSQMKGLGNLSGVALKLMFMDAHMKVENKIEILGEMFQRRLNLLKAMCGKVADSSLEEAVKTLTVEPVFTPYLPRNEKEELETLNIGAGGKAVMSQKTAVKNNPYVQDSEAEMEQIKEEENNAATRQTFEY
jgi:SPP1 family phage portal protein